MSKAVEETKKAAQEVEEMEVEGEPEAEAEA
jgi:hypothetical protein